MDESISIIIPVYNTKKEMLEKCVYSILNQTFCNIEIILVDDGSTNDAGGNCDRFGKKYSNIKVIHKPNGGLSSARNAGQRIASGAWLMFVDSDDWIDIDTCQELINEIKGSEHVDFVVFGHIQHLGEKKIQTKFKFNNHSIQTNEDFALLNESLEFPSQFSSSCWKLFSHDFINANKLEHNESVRQGSEDLEFMVRVLTKTHSVLMVNKYFYHYVMNNESITNSFDEKNAYAVQNCFIEIEKTIKGIGDNKLNRRYYIRSWYALCSSIISGYMNPQNGLRYIQKKRKTKEYVSTEFAKRIIQNVHMEKMEKSRKVVLLCVRHNLYFPIYILACLRGLQKRR